MISQYICQQAKVSSSLKLILKEIMEFHALAIYF